MRIVLLILAVGVLFELTATHIAHAQSPAEDEPADAPEEQLAAKYAPILYLREQEHECDTGGQVYEPVPVEFVLDNPDITLEQDSPGRPVVAGGPTAGDLFAKGNEYYLNFPGDPRRPGCAYDRYFREREFGYQRVAYAHIAREPGHEGFALQYWFFYYFNHWAGMHEGDWEMIQLVFEAETAEEALQQEPVRVAYAQHSGGETASWDDDKLQKEGGRPVIYVGTGSQAGFYDQAVFFQGKTGKQAGIGCDVASGPSRRVEVAALLVPGEVTDRADPFAWLSFHGRWGEKVSGGFSGPTGPNDKGQWTQPFTWEEGLRDSSLKVPFGTAMGPNAAEASCAVVASVSEFLFQNSPFLLIGLAVVAGGSIVITTTRTRFSPFVREPFRQRRRFGQTLSGALTILLRRAPLFLGISLILVPLGIVASAIQGLILSSPSVDPVVDFAGNVVFAGILALAIGVLELGIAYWAVLLGVSAAIGRLEAGRPTGVAQAYRLVWDRIGALLAARLRALAIVAMLAITLVGIPWALLYGVRWAFLEHAILLEGKDAREAFTSSSDLVKGSWWRLLGALLVLAAIGMAIGPLVGVALLLLGPAPLGAMNLISSSISFMLVPFVAIALALLYFDLRVQRGG